uniref:Calmodulin binding protein C-terminal domain-containing protein n=2 Tax=Opuntia streptacantha TaxID=393608 RepID=A0A7C9B014_OPUST
MVKHANECHLDSTQYSYYNDDERVELLFNSIYKVIAVKFHGQNYLPIDVLDLHQKALVDELKLCAFGKEKKLVPLHSPSASTSIVPSSIQPNVSFYGANLDFQHDGFSIIDQELPEEQLGFNTPGPESASYPCTVESAYKPENDSTENNKIMDEK